ncbi:MAG TPA: GAF domain-containing protein [Candidatus Acidoferrales bacterium]|nr:GAF domain-containing protein [Candidatus Acidoferrales bacterium]
MEPSSHLLDLATIFYACRDTETLLKTLAGRLGTSLDARAVIVWIAAWDNEGDDESETETISAKLQAAWFASGERFEPVANMVSEGVLVQVLESGEPLEFSSKSEDEDILAHLAESSRERVEAELYCPLPGPQRSAGVVEILNPRRGRFTPDELQYVREVSRLAGLALENCQDRERQVHEHLTTVERLTALYDISRIFNSTLEMEELLPVITEKIRDLLNASACNLWLVDAETNSLHAMQQAGEDPTLGEGAQCAIGEGVVGKAAQLGQPVLVEAASEDEMLAERRKNETEDFHLESVICSPLLKGEEVMGAIEVVNRIGGGAFSEEDLYFLSNISEQAAIAISNAKLLDAERKVSVLDALLGISREITSTLDLDHVLRTVVQQASTIIPFDRGVIGLFDRDRFLLGAVSGETEVPKTLEMDQFKGVLEWAARQESAVSVDRDDDGWRLDPPEAKESVAAFLENHGYAGFYALPLRDDQGAIGAIGLLSQQADFLDDDERETLAILGNQTAVAIRNAQLYQQVPLAGFLKPWAERKEKLFAAMPKARWIAWAWRGAIAAALLFIIPMPMRIGANATVVPAARRVVAAEAGGIVDRVMVHEGSKVKAGELLAALDSSADQLKLVQAQTALANAQRALADAEFRGDPSAAGQAHIEVQLHQAEVQFERTRVSEAMLLAPISGIVVTPKVEQKVGAMLKPGDAFCELVDPSEMAVEMSVRETDMPLLRDGIPVQIKLNALPLETLRGTVDRLGAVTRSENGEQFFVVRADFANSGLAARDGMVGSAKILAAGGWFSSGWFPLGYVIFRAPFRWAWESVWSWLP